VRHRRPTQEQPVAAPVVEAFVAGEEELADAIERVTLAASIAQGLVLHPAAHLVEAPAAGVGLSQKTRLP
jgi:hypothetical protein